MLVLVIVIGAEVAPFEYEHDHEHEFSKEDMKSVKRKAVTKPPFFGRHFMLLHALHGGEIRPIVPLMALSTVLIWVSWMLS